MGVRDRTFAQMFAGAEEPTTADMLLARKLVGGGGGSVTIVPWSTGTDEEIVAMLQAAHAGKIDLQTDGGWAVGDTRTITVGAYVDGSGASHAEASREIVITDFTDYMNCGCVMQFDFKKTVGSARMNQYNNAGGWGSCEMHTATLPAIVNALPAWLKSALIEFSCLASAGSQSSEIKTVPGNKLALRSEVEIFGITTYSRPGEGSQIAYYETEANRVKGNGAWWERSPATSNNYRFCYTNYKGWANQDNVDNTYGISPFGCL